MPINAGAIGIQPVGPQRPAGGVDGVQRRGDGTSAGFRPQTEVSLKTAIEDLAATLGRIASQEKFGVEQLPANIGQVVRNILQQSLSMEETLAQGIGSTIESQRFSTEQLSIFARMLSQIGMLAEKGFSMELSDETKALLTQFKNLVVASEGGRAFEPVLLSKAAFELVDSKTPEQLPPALQEMLTQLSQAPASSQPSEPMQFLKQIVQLLMPRPSAEENSAQVQQQTSPLQQQARPTATQQLLSSMYRKFDAPYAQPQQAANFSTVNQPTQMSQPAAVQNPQAPSAPTANQQPIAQGSPAPAAQNFSAPIENNAAQAQPQPTANFSTPNQTPVQNQQAPTAQPSAGQTVNFSTTNQQAVESQSTPAANQQPAAQGQSQQPVQSAAGQTANIPVENSPAQQVQQPPGQTATANQSAPAAQNFSAPIENNAAQAQPQPTANFSTPNQTPVQNQQAPTAQSSAGQTVNFSTTNQQAVESQSTPAANQQPVAQGQSQQPVQSAAGQTANIPVKDSPAPQAQPMQQAANSSTANQPAQPSPAQIPTPNQTPVQNQPAQMSQPAAGQTANISAENSPAQSSQPQQRAETPRDDFTVSVPKKPQASPVDEDFIARQRELMAQMQLAKTQLLQQPLQNTPQTTDALKNLAQFLIRNPASAETMSQRETTLLQNFVNNQQTILPRDEARHLQNLLRLCQQNVPAVVQQAAAQHKLPDLPRLWAFMQLCDMASLPAHMPARSLKRAAREVSDFSNAIRQSMGADNTTVQNQRSFQMMLPLYLGGNFSSYPTYLSVYDETARDKETGAEKKETWLRICVLTDNIGAAELIFRVYEKTQLDMRFYFSQGEVAEDFKSYVASLRNFIGGTSFSIGEIRIGSIGEKLLLAQ